MTPEERAQVEAFIAAGKVTKCPTFKPEDASVEGFLKRLREERGGKKMRFTRPRRPRRRA